MRGPQMETEIKIPRCPCGIITAQTSNKWMRGRTEPGSLRRRCATSPNEVCTSACSVVYLPSSTTLCLYGRRAQGPCADDRKDQRRTGILLRAVCRQSGTGRPYGARSAQSDRGNGDFGRQVPLWISDGSVRPCHHRLHHAVPFR